MLTLLFSFIIVVIVYVPLTQFAHLAPIWAALIALFIAGLFQMIMGFIIRKKITKIITLMQATMGSAAETLRHKYEVKAQRGGNMKVIMEEARKEQNQVFTEAIETTHQLDPLVKWGFMLQRQINAMRFQFLYQKKDFEACDQLIQKMQVADPITAAMKICRHYQRNEFELAKKTYKKTHKKFKLQSVLIYAAMAWIYEKKGEKDEAIKVLIEGKKNTENEVLIQCWEALVNNKPKQFSFAALGEQWYVLLLEEPKQQLKQPTNAPAYHPAHKQFMSGGKWKRRY